MWSEAKSCKLFVTRNSAGKQLWKSTHSSSYWSMHPTKKISTAELRIWRNNLHRLETYLIEFTQKRIRTPENKRKPKPPHDDKKVNACQFCGIRAKGQGQTASSMGKRVACVQTKGHFARMCRGKKNQRDPPSKSQSSTSRNRNSGNHLKTSPSQLCYCWRSSQWCKRKDKSWFVFHSQRYRWAQAGETPDLTQEQDSSTSHRYPVRFSFAQREPVRLR